MWTDLTAEVAEEFEGLSDRQADMFMALQRRSTGRQLYPSKVWWTQKRAARRSLARANRVCADPRCRRVFTGKRSDSLYCSHGCRDRWRAVKYQRRKAARLKGGRAA